MHKPVLALLAIAASLAMQAQVTRDPPRSSGSGQVASMSESASAFLATLTPQQRAKVMHRFDDDAARTN